MHLLHLLALFGLAAAAPTSLITLNSTTWTLHNFVRICDQISNRCSYKFSILDNHHSTEILCGFTDIVKPTDPAPLRSARYSSPTKLHCSPDSHVYVNIGYDQTDDFYVIVPVDTQANRTAFFGYTAAEIADHNIVSPDHESAVLAVGAVVEKRDAAPMPKTRDLPDLGAWTVQGFHRACSSTACDYSFTVDLKFPNSTSGRTQPCHLTVLGNNTRNFYAEPCAELSDWVVSWGYNQEFEFAVMTVAWTLAHKMAFFGFDEVNNRTDWADVGPNAVIQM